MNIGVLDSCTEDLLRTSTRVSALLQVLQQSVALLKVFGGIWGAFLRERFYFRAKVPSDCVNMKIGVLDPDPKLHFPSSPLRKYSHV